MIVRRPRPARASWFCVAPVALVVAVVVPACAREQAAQQAVAHPLPRALGPDECPPARCWPPTPTPPDDLAGSGCGPFIPCHHDLDDHVQSLCPDGKSYAGETGRCLRAPDGRCHPEVRRCP